VLSGTIALAVVFAILSSIGMSKSCICAIFTGSPVFVFANLCHFSLSDFCATIYNNGDLQ
jgi:hypothetical protein